jgi:hypothetical protein
MRKRSRLLARERHIFGGRLVLVTDIHYTKKDDPAALYLIPIPICGGSIELPRH